MSTEGKNPTYKEVHGETRVGKFLRSIGKSEILAKAISVASKQGGILGAIGTLLSEDRTLTPEEYQLALKELEMDMQEQEAITRRWEADAKSDSWLSKNVRPMTLVTLVITLVFSMVLDSSIEGFELSEQWLSVLENLSQTVFYAYFGSRGAEKLMNTWKK